MNFQRKAIQNGFCEFDFNSNSKLNLLLKFESIFLEKLLPAVDRMDSPKGRIEKSEIRDEYIF